MINDNCGSRRNITKCLFIQKINKNSMLALKNKFKNGKILCLIKNNSMKVSS